MESVGSGTFKILDDGTIYVRTGVQTNCGGIAGIHVRISSNPIQEILCRVSVSEGEHNDGFGFAVPAFAVSAEFRDAIFEGAAKAYLSSETEIGIIFELLDALVHEIDARESKFRQAGSMAVDCWLKLSAQNKAE